MDGRRTSKKRIRRKTFEHNISKNEIERMNKQIKENWHYLIAFILFLMGMFFAIRAYAIQNPDAMRHVQLYQCHALIYENCKTSQQKLKFHKENAERCYEEAKNKCWWLPNVTNQKNARYCLTNAGAMVAFGDPKSKLMAVIVNTLVQYGLDCCDEWEYINNKLYWAEYHYEMMEFFERVIKNGER